MELGIKELTKENFLPFGYVIEQPEHGAFSTNDVYTYWHDIFGNDIYGREVVSFLQYKKRPMVIYEMERHLKSAEVFIPVRGKAVMAFAPAQDDNIANEKPDLSKACAFIIDGTKSFLINKGVWHAAAFPFDDKMDFILVLPDMAIDNSFSDVKDVGRIVIST